MQFKIVVFATAAAVAMGAEPKTLKSGETKTSILELFTSEGCRSCPPQQKPLPALSDEKVGVVSATPTGAETWTVKLQPAGNMAAGKIGISAALLGFEITSRVRAGENSGKTLKHDFVVLQFATSQAKPVGQSFEANIRLPSNPKLDAKRLAVVF